MAASAVVAVLPSAGETVVVREGPALTAVGGSVSTVTSDASTRRVAVAGSASRIAPEGEVGFIGGQL